MNHLIILYIAVKCLLKKNLFVYYNNRVHGGFPFFIIIRRVNWKIIYSMKNAILPTQLYKHILYTNNDYILGVKVLPCVHATY